MSVIKLGGCNGSGKSTVARAVLDLTAEGEPQYYTLESGKKAKFYNGSWMDKPVFVLGKYDNACGGMDTISDKHDRFGMVKHFAESYGRDGLVFFEGLITGKTYGAMGQLSEEHVALKKPIMWLYTFMDTPFDVCVERVLQRRAARREAEQYDSGPDMFDPMRTMDPTYRSCQRLAHKLRTGELHPHPVHMVSHKAKPVTAAKQLLNAALEVMYAR